MCRYASADLGVKLDQSGCRLASWHTSGTASNDMHGGTVLARICEDLQPPCIKFSFGMVNFPYV